MSHLRLDAVLACPYGGRVLRRLLLGSLLVAAAVVLMSLSVVAGTLLTLCILVSPRVVAVALNEMPVRDDRPSDF